MQDKRPTAVTSKDTAACRAMSAGTTDMQPLSARLYPTSANSTSHLQQLPHGVLIRICLCVDDPHSLHCFLATCKHMSRLSRDAQLVSDWLLAYRRPRALLLSCSKGNTEATMRMLNACDSPLRPNPRCRHVSPHYTHNLSSSCGKMDNQQQHGSATSASPTAPMHHAAQHHVAEQQHVHATKAVRRAVTCPAAADLADVQPLYVDNNDAEAALCAAATAGHKDLVLQLLQWGIPAAGTAASGRPLTAAAAAGQLAIVQALMLGQPLSAENCNTLLSNGALDMPTSKPGCTADASASKSAVDQEGQAGRASVRRQLFQHQLNAAPVHGRCGNHALLAAAGAGHLPVVKLLLDSAAGTAAARQDAMSAAAAAGYLDVVQLLATSGARSTVAVVQALAEAAAHDQLHVMQWLWHNWQPQNNTIDHVTQQATAMGMDPFMQAAGAHVLTRAAAAGVVGAMTQLLAWGIDVNAENGAALCAAAYYGRIQAILVLLRAGANTNVQDGAPVRLACEQDHTEVVNLLLSNGAYLPPAAHNLLIAAASRGRLQMLRLLVAVGVNPHVSDEAALRGAASGGWLDCCKELLHPRCCANVHANEDEALLWAVDNGHEAVVRLLLAHGACAHGDMGQHMLWCAVSRGCQGIVHALMDAGASLMMDTD